MSSNKWVNNARVACSTRKRLRRSLACYPRRWPGSEMDHKTSVVSVLLVVSTVLFTLVFWQFMGFPREVASLVVMFWLVVVLTGFAVTLLRRSPWVVTPLVLASVVVLVAAAPTVFAWTAWSVRGFAP